MELQLDRYTTKADDYATFLLVFLAMSATTHVYSAWLAGSRRVNSYTRPIMLLALGIGVAPVIRAALSQTSP
jgi:hypothetical protein